MSERERRESHHHTRTRTHARTHAALEVLHVRKHGERVKSERLSEKEALPAKMFFNHSSCNLEMKLINSTSSIDERRQEKSKVLLPKGVKEAKERVGQRKAHR